MLDLWLAVAHHLLFFALFGILVTEFALIRPGMDAARVRSLGRMDLSYGALAVLILLVGFARAGMAAKGWAYYSHNLFFWAKVATFALIGVLSIPPTVALIRWRRAGASPDAAAVAGVRRWLWAELGLFALLPVFAALMARDYGGF